MPIFFATAGIVLGIVSLMGAIIPIIGMYSIYLGIPALLISLMAFFVARTYNYNISLAIVAFTICLISVGFSSWQYYMTNKITKDIQQQTNEIYQSTQELINRSNQRVEPPTPEFKIIIPSKNKK